MALQLPQTDLIYVKSTDVGSPMAGFYMDRDGVVFAPLVNKTSLGEPAQAVGAYYKAANGGSGPSSSVVTAFPQFWRPMAMCSRSPTMVRAPWMSGFTTPSGATEYAYGVPLGGSDTVSAVQELRSAGFTGEAGARAPLHCTCSFAPRVGTDSQVLESPQIRKSRGLCCRVCRGDGGRGRRDCLNRIRGYPGGRRPGWNRVRRACHINL